MMKYERPKMFKITDLGVTEGLPDCSNGSAVTDYCTNGDGAPNCQSGAIQFSYCRFGTNGTP